MAIWLKNAERWHNCKTHKPRGNVEPRLIQAAHKSPMAPAMRLISWMLRQRLVHFPDLLRDSDHLIQQIRHLRVPQSRRSVGCGIRGLFQSIVRHKGAAPDPHVLSNIISNDFLWKTSREVQT